MGKVYGYARISTGKQNIERQVSNILQHDSNAIIFQETFTGRSSDRPEWQRLLSIVKAGDKIIFDEISRMSRNAAEGYQTYSDLFQKGVELTFLKEPYCNSEKYKAALERQITLSLETGNKAFDKLGNGMIDLLNNFLLDMARQDISSAFQSAEQEVEYLSRRTSEGVLRAKAAGKQIGREIGSEIVTQKEIAAVEVIRKHSKDFGGSLSDTDCRTLAGVSRNSFYRYKARIKSGEYDRLIKAKEAKKKEGK